MVETFEHLNSKQVYLELEKASREWKDWQGKAIVLDEGKKATFSKCFLKHKLDKILQNLVITLHSTRFST